MKIVHYLFGLPPVRTGGVPRYVLDLAEAQHDLGHEVILLVPGPIGSQRNRIKIKRTKSQTDIPCYRIHQPQYIPNGYGIRCPEQFMLSGSHKVYCDWLMSVSPDVLHIHSLMGLHAELPEAAGRLGIPVIYTTHDFFGLCPKIDLLKNDVFCTETDWTNCGACCQQAYPLKRLRLEQSDIYKLYCRHKGLMDFVHSGIGNKLKLPFSFHRQNVSDSRINAASDTDDISGNAGNTCVATAPGTSSVSQSQPRPETTAVSGYPALAAYYRRCFSAIDHFHFNSRQTNEIFLSRLPDITGTVLPVSNKGIRDKRRARTFGHTLRIGYLGSSAVFKGYHYLLDELSLLYESGRQDFYVNTYFPENPEIPYIHNHGPFPHSELEKVFDDMDLLVVPSICKETFGMVVPEALSHGVPVLVSENVGARMILNENCREQLIFPIKKGTLSGRLIHFYDHRDTLTQINRAILTGPFDLDYKNHVESVLTMYRELIPH